MLFSPIFDQLWQCTTLIMLEHDKIVKDLPWNIRKMLEKNWNLYYTKWALTGYFIASHIFVFFSRLSWDINLIKSNAIILWLTKKQRNSVSKVYWNSVDEFYEHFVVDVWSTIINPFYILEKRVSYMLSSNKTETLMRFLWELQQQEREAF